MTDETQEFWDRMYGQRDCSPPAQPHPYLVDESPRTNPGAALELGCGDGTNAIWLATQGWTVTAVDVSQVALNRAADNAARAGVASRVRWQRTDLRDWTTPETFDLVTALFVHTPLELDYASMLAQNAERTRAGGTLLVIGHYTLPPWAWDPDNTDGLPSASELVSRLALHEPHWHVRRAEEVARTVMARDGHETTVLDAVLHAVRCRG